MGGRRKEDDSGFSSLYSGTHKVILNNRQAVEM